MNAAIMIPDVKRMFVFFIKFGFEDDTPKSVPVLTFLLNPTKNSIDEYSDE